MQRIRRKRWVKLPHIHREDPRLYLSQQLYLVCYTLIGKVFHHDSTSHPHDDYWDHGVSSA